MYIRRSFVIDQRRFPQTDRFCRTLVEIDPGVWEFVLGINKAFDWFQWLIQHLYSYFYNRQMIIIPIFFLCRYTIQHGIYSWRKWRRYLVFDLSFQRALDLPWSTSFLRSWSAGRLIGFGLLFVILWLRSDRFLQIDRIKCNDRLKDWTSNTVRIPGKQTPSDLESLKWILNLLTARRD